MALSWSTRRQLLYCAVAAVVAVFVLWWGYNAFFNKAPTCRDGVQNGDERGVDCGGSCALLCAADARAPVVLWSRAFRTDSSHYSAAAYIQNPNTGAFASGVRYAFQLFDEDNLLVVERTGTTALPPLPTIPIIEPNIPVGNRSVSRTIFSFSEVPVWKRADEENLAYPRATGVELAPDGASLSATLVNDSRQDARGVTAVAVLFDKDGIARAASRSTLDVPARSRRPVHFTWGFGVAEVVRAEITVLPRVR